MNIKFSVLIPMYNAEKYIYECIKSVIEQTYYDFELIIIDDGSTDNSIDIVKKCATSDSRITYFQQSNIGLFRTRQNAVHQAKGEFIVFIDADDYWESNMLTTLSNIIEKEHSDVVIYSYRDIFQDGKINIPKPAFDAPITFSNDKKDLYDIILNGSSINTIWSKTFRKELFDIEKFASMHNIRMGEDLVYTLEIIKRSRCITYIPDILYNYRILKTSMTRTFDRNTISGYSYIYSCLYDTVIAICNDKLDSIYKLNNRYLQRVIYYVLLAEYDESTCKKEYIGMLTELKNDALFLSIVSSNMWKHRWYVVLFVNMIKYSCFNLITLLRNIIIKHHKLEVSINRLLKPEK